MSTNEWRERPEWLQRTIRILSARSRWHGGLSAEPSSPHDHHEPQILSDDSYPLQKLTGRIIHASQRVHRTLGYGFSEMVYRRALAVELQFMGVAVAQEVPYEVVYRGVVVGVYHADLVVESAVIVETKTGLLLDPVTPNQLLNYLSAARLPIGLICHFGPRLQVKRMVRSEYVEAAVRTRR